MKCRAASILTGLLASAVFLSTLAGCASRRAPAEAESGEPRLDFGLGADFQSRTIHGLDFDVTYLHSPKRKSSMAVYVGFHPSLRSLGRNPRDLKEEAGQIGGVSVEWTRWHEQKTLHSEALARGLYQPLGRPPHGDAANSEARAISALVVHIFITAEEPAEVARLQTAASRLKLEPGK